MIATILLVAITVVLAAVLYVMLGTIIRDVGTTPATLTLLPPEARGAGEWRIGVNMQTGEDLGKFQVALRNLTQDAPDPTPCDQTNLKDGLLCESGGVRLSLDDAIGPGKLQGGDAFVLSGVAPGKTYELVLIWRQGSIAYPGKTVGGN